MYDIEMREGGFVDESIQTKRVRNVYQRGYSNNGDFRIILCRDKTVEKRSKEGNQFWTRGRFLDIFKLGFFRESENGFCKEGSFISRKIEFNSKRTGMMVAYTEEVEDVGKNSIVMHSNSSMGKNYQKLILGEDNVIRIEKKRVE